MQKWLFLYLVKAHLYTVFKGEQVSMLFFSMYSFHSSCITVTETGHIGDQLHGYNLYPIWRWEFPCSGGARCFLMSSLACYVNLKKKKLKKIQDGVHTHPVGIQTFFIY
eukprot:TRINITY_DN10758_c0_g3_i1.p1 TRINITY_DN10758_c0_g3~~TRINITY_DN10758_c0_g3_i1.p1  ORF type:complete len:109 (+),score=3.41 TRINITY_DN10758_c0_g3_i1:181-507(+)